MKVRRSEAILVSALLTHFAQCRHTFRFLPDIVGHKRMLFLSSVVTSKPSFKHLHDSIELATSWFAKLPPS